MSWATCTLDWYRLPTDMARDMVLVTAVANVPLKFTAGKFLDLSFRTFGTVSYDIISKSSFFQKIQFYK